MRDSIVKLNDLVLNLTQKTSYIIFGQGNIYTQQKYNTPKTSKINSRQIQ